MKDTIDLKQLYELWLEYKKDPKVTQNPNPPLGIVFTFEGFWMWLIENYIKK